MADPQAAEEELGDPRTDPTVIALRERRLNYFILVARPLGL